MPATTAEIGRLVQALAGEHPGRIAEDAAAFSEALREGNVRVEEESVRGLLYPKLFSLRAEQILREAGERFALIGGKAIRRFWESASFRALFSFPGDVESLLLIRPKAECLVPMLRVDVFYNEETGGFQLCELNTDGTSGMIEDAELNRAFRATETFRELSAIGEITSYELFDSLAQCYRDLYERPEENPVCAVVDFLEYASSIDEFERYRRSFEKTGSESLVCDVRDLVFDGKVLRTRSGRQIDLIYRRAVTSDLLAHREEAEPLLAAYRAGAVCLLGGICTQIVHDKAFLPAILSDEAKEFLTAEERDYLHAHVPETALFSKEAVKRFAVLEEKDRWVLKPRSSYGSRGVFIGKEMTRDEWADAVEKSAGASYLLQEFVEPFFSWNAEPLTGRTGDYGNTTGIYVFGGRYTGLYSRASQKTVISTSKGGFDAASAVFHPFA